MEKDNMWGKIKKSVAEGVAVATEKTEEYMKLGKAKLNMLAIRRRIAQKRTELGGAVYTAVKEGKEKGIFAADQVKSLVSELDSLDADLAKKRKEYEDLRLKAASDMREVKKKAESGVKDITTKAKSKVTEIKKKARTKVAGTKSAAVKGEEKKE